MPDLQKVAIWAGVAILLIMMVWLMAKAVLPFTIGVICGSAATWLLSR
jgi:predicted PurR-regulated permease PerM